MLYNLIQIKIILEGLHHFIKTNRFYIFILGAKNKYFFSLFILLKLIKLLGKLANYQKINI
jgi:hypothetical protein